MIYSFKNDYNSIAHPRVLEKLTANMDKQFVGYGLDEASMYATELIRNELQSDSDIHFLIGGTSANLIVIGALLRPYEAVICADSGHINVHETGAVEGSGHKCLICDSVDGKVTTAGIMKVLSLHTDKHMVKPKMVYISNTTELGSVYTLSELKEIYEACKQNGLYLFLDGARLASALAASDITLCDYARYTDVFYIGGTKNGAPLGEAVVINNPLLKPDFDYAVKRFGGLLAKGFVQGLCFTALFEDSLYYEIGKKENECAKILTEGLRELGYSFYSNSVTNQVFVIVDRSTIEYIGDNYLYETWATIDEDNVAIRLVTSFTTTPSICYDFLDFMRKKNEN